MTDTNDLREDEFIFETITTTASYIIGWIHHADGTPFIVNGQCVEGAITCNDYPELPADDDAWYAVRGTIEGTHMTITEVRPCPDATRVKLDPVVEAFHVAANRRWEAEYLAEQAAA